MRRQPTQLAAIRRWPVWTSPPPFIGLLLAVYVLTLITVGVLAVHTQPSVRDLCDAVVVAGLGVANTEFAVGVERARNPIPHSRRIGGFHDVQPVWTFAAATLLPPFLAAAVAIVVHQYTLFRATQPIGGAIHRELLAHCTMILAVVSSSLLIHDVSPAQDFGLQQTLTFAAAMGVYVALDTGLVSVTTGLFGSPSRRRPTHALGVWLEVATLSAGAVLGLTLGGAQPYLGILVLPVIGVLQFLLGAVDLDGSPVSAAAEVRANATWFSAAYRHFRRARRRDERLALLLVDVPGLAVIDRDLGGAAADRAAGRVADVLTGNLDRADLVGRSDLRRFVVMLTAPTPERAAEASTTVRAALLAAPDRFEVCIGGARFPDDAGELPDLFEVAERAAEAAVAHGAGTVVLRTPPDGLWSEYLPPAARGRAPHGAGPDPAKWAGLGL